MSSQEGEPSAPWLIPATETNDGSGQVSDSISLSAGPTVAGTAPDSRPASFLAGTREACAATRRIGEWRSDERTRDSLQNAGGEKDASARRRGRKRGCERKAKARGTMAFFVSVVQVTCFAH